MMLDQERFDLVTPILVSLTVRQIQPGPAVMPLSIKHSLAWAGYRFASTVLE